MKLFDPITSSFIIYFLLPISIFIIYFRDLLFRTASKPKIIMYEHPNKKILEDFFIFNYPEDQGNVAFNFINKILTYFDNLLYKEKIALVFGEGNPFVYTKEFLKLAKIVKQTGTTIEMIGGPVFLRNGDNYILEAAEKGLINLYIPNKRIDIHFRVNLLTGELYYESRHEPNAIERRTLYMDQNYFEAKAYIKKFRKYKRNAKPFKSCEEGKDYIMVTIKELEKIKKCLMEKRISNFNNYTIQEIRSLCVNGL